MGIKGLKKVVRGAWCVVGFKSHRPKVRLAAVVSVRRTHHAERTTHNVLYSYAIASKMSLFAALQAGMTAATTPANAAATRAKAT